ncbi:hypothetical protein HPB47_018611 [Ixodes persulcatus]|uniref:Uncharacterized protein n=1 Tax=Ixodes persulcatus TaxID=34615 RepID=A0AC60QNT1_IXOPE|nr:hypothetical protein HPB47_018611 [Ixodes persulcatus]
MKTFFCVVVLLNALVSEFDCKGIGSRRPVWRLTSSEELPNSDCENLATCTNERRLRPGKTGGQQGHDNPWTAVTHVGVVQTEPNRPQEEKLQELKVDRGDHGDEDCPGGNSTTTSGLSTESLASSSNVRPQQREHAVHIAITGYHRVWTSLGITAFVTVVVGAAVAFAVSTAKPRRSRMSLFPEAFNRSASGSLGRRGRQVTTDRDGGDYSVAVGDGQNKSTILVEMALVV